MADPDQLRILCAITDQKLGTVYIIGTDREWMDLRVTPSGLLRPGITQRGKHPMFAKRAEAADG